jgi:hypothetical protein
MLAIAILLLAQVAVLVWALVRRRGMRPILVANLLFAAAVLIFVVPQLPEELRYIRAGEATELFDCKNTILTAVELTTLVASVLAWCGFFAGKIVAWIGFAGNFALSLMAMQFVLTFKFKCCGYL